MLFSMQRSKLILDNSFRKVKLLHNFRTFLYSRREDYNDIQLQKNQEFKEKKKKRRKKSKNYNTAGERERRAVLQSHLLRSPVRLGFSLRSTKTLKRSKRSRLPSPSGRSSLTSPSPPTAQFQLLFWCHYIYEGFNCCQDSVVLQERKHRDAALIVSKREKAHQAVNRDIYGTNVPEKEDIARVLSLEECEILLGKRKDSEISKTEWRDSITRQVYLLLQPYRRKEEDSHLIDLAFPSSAMEGGDSNCLFMIAKAVAALTLQAMSYAGFCTLEKLLPESAYNIVRESYFNVVVRFVLSVFDMEDFERIYELGIVKDECSTYYSNLCHAHCDPCVAVAEGKVKVEKISILREHDICDIIQQCQGCAENKGFEVYPWAFPFDPDKWDDISQSDIISAMREVLKYVPLKEDCKMQLTLELSRPKCHHHILDNLTLEAVKDVKIQELHRFVDDVSSDESIAEDAKTMLYDFANGIIDGLYVLCDFKGDALTYFQEAIIFPISRGSFGPCTDELRGVINIADNERRMQCQRFISVQHILFGLSFSRVGDNVRMLNDRPRCLGGLHSKLSMFSIYKLSRIAADRLGDKEVGLEHLVLAIFFGKQEDDPIKRVELEYGSSLFFDDNAFDPELVDCLKSSCTECDAKSLEYSAVFKEFLPENCFDGALVKCCGLVVMEKLHEALKCGGLRLSPIREES